MNDLSGIKRILIVDDHPVMRDGLRFMIEQEDDMVVSGEAADGAEATAQFKSLRPDAVLMDLQMPHVDGLHAISGIRAGGPDAVIVVLTSYPGDARVRRAMALGATAYVLKSAGRAQIIAAVRGALKGRASLAPDVAQELAAYGGTEQLNARELSVLRLVATGKQNRCIGDALSVSEETIKSRVKNILAELGARDRTHAVTIAVRRGYLDSF